MSMFLCLVQHDGHVIPADIRRQYSSRHAAQTIAPSRWHCGPGIASLVGSDVVGLRPAVATDGPLTGVGLVQLENRQEVARWAGLASTQACDVVTDLALVVQAARRMGCEWVLARLSGDFALVIWNAETLDATAARDAFGVRCLFIKSLGAITAFASRASLLASSENYDLEYIAEYLVNGYDASSHSAFSDVGALEAGELSITRNGRETRRQYWPAVESSPSAPSSWASAVDNFRDLLVTSVLTRLRPSHPSWAQLSGGMDSSSIVAIAQTLAASGRVRRGLAGAVTYETVPAVGGDPVFARMVAETHRLELQTIRDWWLWQDDQSGPPTLDQPCATLASYSIDRRTTTIVRRAGGEVLLAGVGADVYLRPGLDFIAVLIAHHRFGSAVRELAGWASELRASAWTLGYSHGLYPLLPAAGRMMLARPAARVPGWITPTFRRRFALRGRSAAIRSYSGGVEQQERLRTLYRLHAEGELLPRERLGEENLDWSYPFLSRPLIEFTLELPRHWLMEPGMSKRILREAMRDILPDAVRLRRGKGGIHPQPAKALSLEHDRIAALSEQPVLEELGCVDSRKLREAIRRSERGQLDSGGAILNTLSLEMWLRSRSGRWPRVQLRSHFGDHGTINGRILSAGG